MISPRPFTLEVTELQFVPRRHTLTTSHQPKSVSPLPLNLRRSLDGSFFLFFFGFAKQVFISLPWNNPLQISWGSIQLSDLDIQNPFIL